jgi:hypothetical protein
MNDQQRAAIQMALEALEEVFHSNSTKVAVEKYNIAHNALREALAEQAEQEPVAIDWNKVQYIICEVFSRCISSADGFRAIRDLVDTSPVRTKDPTDDEIESIMVEQGDLRTITFARAVIAADRKLNGVEK